MLRPRMEIPVTDRGGLQLHRRMQTACDGLLALDQTFVGSATRTLVTHRGFMIARIEVVSGALTFPLPSGPVTAPKNFLLVVPPHSTLPMTFQNATIRSQGVAGMTLKGAPLSMALHAATNSAPMLDAAAVRHALAARVLCPLDVDAGADPLLAEGRRLLHELHAHPAPVRTAAQRLGLRLETFSRDFLRTYHLSPKQYCHRARIFDAVCYLAQGTGILDAAFASGFGDLKRFYTQFKRLLGATPSLYVRGKNRQDATAEKRFASRHVWNPRLPDC